MRKLALRQNVTVDVGDRESAVTTVCLVLLGSKGFGYHFEAVLVRLDLSLSWGGIPNGSRQAIRLLSG